MKARDGPKPKLGTGSPGAMGRQGLTEIRNALYPESNVARQVEYGIWGTKTPGEVAEDRRNDVEEMPRNDLNEEPRSILADRVKEAEKARDVRGRDTRNKEIERD